jgi:hypothetical protein
MGVCSLLHHRDFKSQSRRGYRRAAVTLRCNVDPCNLPPVTFNPLAPHPLAPLPLPRCRYGRSAAAPPTSSYYPAPRASRPSRSLPRASRLIPLRPYHCPAAGTGAAPLRPYVVLPPCPSCLAPLSLLASRLAPHPLAPPPLPRCRYGRSAAAPTSSYHPAPRASRPSRSLPRALRLIPSRPYYCLAAGTGAAPLRPYVVLPPCPSCLAPLSLLASRLAPHPLAPLLLPRCRYGRSTAAPLRRPTTLPLVPRASLAPCLAPRSSRLAPLPLPRCRYGRSGAAPPTSSYHPAPRASRRAPQTNRYYSRLC